MAQGKRRHLLWQPPWHRFSPSCGCWHWTIRSYLSSPSLPDANLCGLTETMPSRHVLVSNVTALVSHQLGFHCTHCSDSVCKARAFGAEPRCGALTERQPELFSWNYSLCSTTFGVQGIPAREVHWWDSKLKCAYTLLNLTLQSWGMDFLLVWSPKFFFDSNQIKSPTAS